jgi:serine protease Do
MSDFNGFNWNKDDYEKNMYNSENKTENNQSYYTEHYITNNKKKRRPILNYISVSIISAIIGGLIFGTTFAFMSPIIEEKYEKNISEVLQENESNNDKVITVDPNVENFNEEPYYESGENEYAQNTEKGDGETAGMPQQINEGDKVLTVPEISKKVGPAVVGITTKIQGRNFWGDPYETEGSGSGIILSSDGFIVTNNHVIEGGTEITVILNDAHIQVDSESKTNKFTATVVGADPKTDLAVLKIDAKNLPYAKLGESSKLDVGEMAVAIGNPLGQEFAGSVTVGVISALNRTINVDDREFKLIQTDAAINPGNSGGALVNSTGEVIGINTIKMSITGVEGMGFAIPIDEAKPIIEDLKTYGYVKGRPLIGIVGRDITQSIAQSYNWPEGIYVIQVSENSGAKAAGILPGDIITKFNGKDIKSLSDLNVAKENLKVGDVVRIRVYREGEYKVFDVTLTEEK